MRSFRGVLIACGACAAMLCAGASTAAAAGLPAVEGIGGPSYGPAEGGYTTTIQGKNFEGASAVDFGATPVSFHVSSPTEIHVTVPAGEAGAVDVRVTTAEGTSEITPVDRWVYTEAPEYGRCVRVPRQFEGEFYDSKCTNHFVEGNAAFEWEPAFGRYFAAKGFALAGAKSTIETTLKQKLTCSSIGGGGEYTSGRTLSIPALTLSGCALTKGSACQSGGAPPGQIVTAALGGQVGLWVSKTVRAGIELAPASGETLAAFACGTTAGTLAGAVIIEASADKMATTATWKGSEKKGVQVPLEFLEGKATPLTLTLGSSTAQAGLKAKLTQTSEEAIELNAAV